MRKLHSLETDVDALIPLSEGARLLGLDASTIRKRAAGTAALTLVPQGRKLFLVRGEVLAHRTKLIEDARRRIDILRLVPHAK